MSFVLYQLGNVPFALWPSSLAGLTIDIPRTFRGEMVRLAESPVAVFEEALPVLEPTVVSVTGTLFGVGGHPVSSQLSQLLSLGGYPFLDVIGYVPNECCSLGAACSVCGGRSRGKVTWLHTTGFLSEVTPSNSIEIGEASPTDLISVDLSLTLRDLFTPLNPWLWQPYYDGAAVSGLIQRDDLFRSALPHQPPLRQFGKPNRLVFNKKNYRYPFELYHVDVWSSFPENTARGRGWGIWNEYLVGGPIGLWSAPPTANYMFTNLPTSGYLQIRVESEMGGSNRHEHTSSLSLASLHTQMEIEGYGGLTPDDIVLATDSIYAPSVVIRNDLMLTVRPVWNYHYQYVGQLLGAQNRVTLSTPVSVYSAHLHQYRAY